MKLTYSKLVRIIKRKKSGLSSGFIARQFGLCTRRIEQVWSYYHKNGEYLPLKKPGRKPYRQATHLDGKILQLNENYGWGATYIAKYLRDCESVRLGHDYIHKLLLKKGMAISNKNKQKRRAPWVRYEREHSLSLVHLDWHYNSVLSKWVAAVLDDASRMVLAGGEFDNALQEHNIMLLEKAYLENLRFGPIQEVLTDHGPQFYPNKQNKDGTAMTEFQKYCANKGMKHILCRYKHPQTNGKYEKWNHTYELFRPKHRSFEEFAEWYNNRPHGSLNFMTPKRAFTYKLQDVILGGFLKWAEK